MKFKNLKLRSKLFLGNSVILLLVIILGFITFTAIQSLLKTSKMVDHTHVVIEEATDILGAAVDMETGMRGYLLAGKEEFLDPYKQGYQAFHEEAETLKKTVSDNPAQVQLLEEIQQNIDAWVENVTEPTIELRREIGDAETMDDMAHLVGEARGKEYFDKFRNQIATFIEREEDLLAKREKDTAFGSGNQAEAARWVKHTQSVIRTAMKIQAAAVDMETGMRGYLLAGNEDFLEPYNKGSEAFFSLVESLKNTVSDNPAQVALLNEIGENIKGWKTNVTEPAIALRRQIGDSKTMNDMAHLVGEARGKQYFDKFRSQIETFIEREKSLMEARQQAAADTARTAGIVTVVGTILIVVIALVISVFITRAVTGPVQKVLAYVEKLANNDFSSKLEVDQTDEIGTMAGALGVTVAELGQMIKKIIGGVNTLSSSSTELSAVSAQLSGNAEDTSNRSSAVASAAEEMSTNMNSVSAAMEQSASNVGMVATATEEMTSTVNEIAQNAAKAKGISEEAVAQSNRTSEKINELGMAATKIGKVTEAITEISEQTNLLALNATIEAARAGEAGKGFAVVANEIKELAKQTAAATVDIKNQIDEMQGTTNGTITDIETIGQVINEINNVINSIATAVEQQSAATSEISENIAQASAGIAEVNENVAQSSIAAGDITKEIGEISNGTVEISQGSANVNDSATELSQLAEQLNGLVNRFKVA